MFYAIVDWLLTPRMRPFRWSRLLFTYLVPLIPLVVLWDGIVSCFRTRTPEELLELTKSFPQYNWTAGYAKGSWLPPGVSDRPAKMNALLARVLPAPMPGAGAPYLARFSRDVGYHRPHPQASRGLHNSVRVPYLRTSVRGPKTMGEAQPQPFAPAKWNWQLRTHEQ